MMENPMDIGLKIKEMAQRIRELREIEGYTPEEMAQKTGIYADSGKKKD